jgi:hypothetical protein
VSDTRFISGDFGSPIQPQHEVLERAVAKVVVMGARVGLDADQMIEMLDSGMTVKDLLEYLMRLSA